MISVSWTRLSDFEKCSLYAYWKHFAPKDLKFPFVETPATRRGKDVHATMERAVLRGTELSGDLEHFNTIVDLVRKNPRDKILTEQQLALTTDYKKTDWFGYNAYWRTIFDVIIVQPKSISIDWKTGNVYEKSLDQLRFSAAAAMLQWPQIKEVLNYYVWLDHPTQKPTKIFLPRSRLKETVQEFEDRVDVIRLAHENNAWEPNPSNFNCKWCPATKAQCKYSRN